MTRFDLFFSLHLGYNFYSLTDNLLKLLQTPTLFAVAAQRLARLTFSTNESMRNDECAKLFYDYVMKCADRRA